jgi:hypothetical protein
MIILPYDRHAILDPFVVTIDGGPFLLASQAIPHMCVCLNPIMDVERFSILWLSFQSTITKCGCNSLVPVH